MFHGGEGAPEAPMFLQARQAREADMSATGVHNANGDATVGRVGRTLEVEIIPVRDVDRAKEFYERPGFGLDDDIAPLKGLRVVQFTPSGSGALIPFGERPHDPRAWLDVPSPGGDDAALRPNRLP